MDIKICGLTRPEDARAAAGAGALYGGVILAPGSPRTVDVPTARYVLGGTGLRRCGVFVNEPLDRLLEVVGEIGLDVVQLHGDEAPAYVAEAMVVSGVEVWKAIRPRSGDDFEDAVDRFGAAASGLLLDGWSAKARGGTGTRFPWEVVAEHRGLLPSGLRLIVAGGLDAGNVAEVINMLDPDVVDVSSGVESAPGIKDEERIREFTDAARVAGGRAWAG